MKLTEEMSKMLESMEKDFKTLKKAQKRKYLNEYEQGFADGAVETFEATLTMMKVLDKKIEKLQEERDELSLSKSYQDEYEAEERMRKRGEQGIYG